MPRVLERLRLEAHSPALSRSLAVFLALACCGTAVTIVLGTSPALQPIPRRDSSAFIYAGMRIIEGEVLYVDLWDHKGPLIHHLNALALSLGSGLWGILALRAAWLCLGFLIGFLTLRRAFGMLPALAGTFISLGGMARLLEGGNLVEEFALLFQFAALATTTSFSRKNWRAPITLGISLGACFLLRPNLMALPLSAGLILLLAQRTRSEKLRLSVLSLAGFVGISGLYLATLLIQGAAYDFLDGYFCYNFAYSDFSASSALGVGKAAWKLLGVGVVLLLVAWAALLVLLTGKDAEHAGKSRRLLWTALLAFPLEVAATTVSGRYYAHYFLTWLPVAAVLIAFAVWLAVRETASSRNKFLKAAFVGAAVLLYGTWIAATGFQAMGFYRVGEASGRWSERGHAKVEGERQFTELVRWLGRTEKSVLVWGAETAINVCSSRPAPTKYYYLYPLLTRGYQDDERVAQFRRGILESKPMIVDTSGSNPLVPPLDPRKRSGWHSGDQRYGLIPAFGQLFEDVEQHYRPVAVVSHWNWVVYDWGGGGNRPKGTTGKVSLEETAGQTARRTRGL